jgi:hypothetical protein
MTTLTIKPGVEVGSEVRVTRFDGRTFSGRLRVWGVESVVLDVAIPSRSTRYETKPHLIRIATTAVQTIEPFNRAAGFVDG